MPKKSPFTIYNASAGSGKTYTLVKEYLKILFSSNSPFEFRRILAITFTNKAVAKMKERIVDTLKIFSDENILTANHTMFQSICEELEIAPESLHEKSGKLLNTILHNYAAFDISTIDGFTHKIIRTFAHDLKLPLNFEVELDQEALLNEAVDSLIAKAGTNDVLTQILVDFAIEKADDDKSWDVTIDFNKIAKLLVNENDIPFLETLKDKTLADFNALKKQLKSDIKQAENAITEAAQNVLTTIENAGVDFKDFSRGTLPNHFIKAAKLDFNRLYDNKLEENIAEGKSIYNKTLNPQTAQTIDSILPEIEVAFKTVKKRVFKLKFLRAFYKNITPISVLNAINQELIALKEEQNKMLISEFNSIINNEIKAQPTPFIYERIGEKFKHYFIDEFQDTSVVQWQNLVPLLGNSLSAENGSTMLVGDAKQAIYRWRGGKAEQFIDLFNDENPFYVEKSVRNLPANFRSFKEVVSFNNGLFSFLAHQVFNNDMYSQLYNLAQQDITKTNDGYVELEFLDLAKDDDRDAEYTEKVLEKINTCLNNGYNLADICVLVRKKKDGVAVANYLSQNNIPIISSETLLLNNAPEVQFINHFLGLLLQPKNKEIKIKVLQFLAKHFNVEDQHNFFEENINLSVSELMKKLEPFDVFIKAEGLLQLPLFDLAETIVRQFNLVQNSNAYIQFYLDVVLDFTQKKGSDISGFLEYFDKKKDNLSIVSPLGQNAVQIMTIHKSKGLEFPVVIFPYADLDIYREKEPKEWFAINKEQYQGFTHTLLNYNKDFEYFGDEGQQIYDKHQAELELDNINLLYVALTRAAEQLYIVSAKDISTKGEANTKKYSGLLISYLQHLCLWEDSKLIYSFGSSKKASTTSEEKQTNTQLQDEFISTAKEQHHIKVVIKSSFLWDTAQKEAIERGNLIHDIMAQIKTKSDIDFVIDDFLGASIIDDLQASALKETVVQIINHPILSDYFAKTSTIYNERDIITKQGVILRPDKVAVNKKNEAVIIDYKTGVEDKKHIQQLQLYQDVLEEMGIVIKKRILVYINDDIKIKQV
ncbi:UvrD-helicase domain-containing protein [Tamlana crocina]|uniref:DNA 3'-5' helicase n=1 Tax=Tamlana crocina TaxID=393006 RepID=A0ABX1D6F4_9FLAO|nr:UvrD-helicase domain-containing protein [Tamlana crocina]NJX13901.1 UvrD-helicase domain-containing protein [Tamlana crocina]